MTVQLAIRVDGALLAEVDRLIAARPELSSRSEVVRRALERVVAELRRDEIDRAIVDGYRRAPQASMDDWGQPVEHAYAAAQHNARRLDDEDGGW